MREPFQILAVPYRICAGAPQFCVLHRADGDIWQFVAGGGEDGESPSAAAVREIREETGAVPARVHRLTGMAYVPAEVIAAAHRAHWPPDTIVIPEYAFSFECADPILSREHDRFAWLPYDDARRILRWDSNKVAMYETLRRLEVNRL